MMKPHILVVDDDAEIRETVIEMLRDRGHHVLGAAEGGEALEVLRSRAPWCVILLDLMMPGMDGWEMREKQLADPSLSTIPVVVISATTDVPKEAEKLRADAFLVKPVRLADMIATIERFCPPSTSA